MMRHTDAIPEVPMDLKAGALGKGRAITHLLSEAATPSALRLANHYDVSPFYRTVMGLYSTETKRSQTFGTG
jgi:hypothetical protein